MTAVRHLLRTLVVAPVLLGALAPVAVADEPFVELSVADAMARAQKEGKLFLMHFYGTVQPESRRMMEKTWPDAEVQKWVEEHAVAVAIDVEDQREVPNRFREGRAPATVLRGADGSLIEAVRHSVDPVDLLMLLESAVSGDVVPGFAVPMPSGDKATDPAAWLEYANYMFGSGGDPVKTLYAYTWCMEHGEKYSPGFRASHFELMLKRIAWMKQRNLESVKWMLQERDQLAGLMSTGVATDRQAWEYVRLNFWLRDDLQSVVFFEELAGKGERQEELRAIVFTRVIDALTAQRKYEAVLASGGDLTEQFDRRLRYIQTPPQPGDEDYEASRPLLPELADTKQKMVSDAACFFEALLGVGRGKDAMEFADLVLERNSTGRAYALFMQKSNRLELWGVTKRLGEKGLGSVPKRGQRNVRAQLNRIPAEDGAAPDDDGNGDGDGGQ